MPGSAELLIERLEHAGWTSSPPDPNRGYTVYSPPTAKWDDMGIIIPLKTEAADYEYLLRRAHRMADQRLAVVERDQLRAELDDLYETMDSKVAEILESQFKNLCDHLSLDADLPDKDALRGMLTLRTERDDLLAALKKSDANLLELWHYMISQLPQDHFQRLSNGYIAKLRNPAHFAIKKAEGN